MHFTGWQVVGLLGLTVIAFMLLSLVLGANLLTLLISPIIGFVLYELWYVAFEASS